MPKRNRQTLKESFRQGKKPSEQDFENLIDSSMNILDDGFSKSPETGMSLAPLLGKSVVMSIYQETADGDPAWQIMVDEKTGNMQICRNGIDGVIPMINLKTDGSLELGKIDQEVIVQGTISNRGRRGNFLQGEVPANGKWQDITENLEGCWALEVIAGCGRKHTGKYALMVATAIHCFGKKRSISKTRSHYGMYGYKLCLRWLRSGLGCRLQIKTIFNYGDTIQINYNVSKLWDSPDMEIKKSD